VIPTSNLLFNLKFNGFVVVVNCARPGETIRRVGKIAQNPNLKAAMSSSDGYAWGAILLSGGGNDLIDDVGKIIRKYSKRKTYPADYCDLDELDKTLASISTITHTYDWMTPRNSPARFFPFKISGPWIYTALKAARVPQSEWNAISDFVVDSLRNTIKGLARGAHKLPNFHVVDTQDTLIPAALGETGVSGDWMNEIHLAGEGYKAMAEKISTKVRALL